MEASETNGRVVVLIDATLTEPQAEKLKSMSARIEVISRMSPEALKRADVIYTATGGFDPSDAPNLKYVQLESAGINHILDKPVANSGLPIATTRGAHSIPTAEFAMALLLNLATRMRKSWDLQSRHAWPGIETRFELYGENCHGKTMGILGYGTIGRHVARIASGMGMRILACKRRSEIREDAASYSLPRMGDPEGMIPEQWFGIEQVREMMRQSDVLVNALPLTEATQGIIGLTELRALPKGAYVISVSRGGIIQEDALLQCLKSGDIAGAGLDVFENEPLAPDSPFWGMSNVIITPHIAGGTQLRNHAAAEVLIENLARYLDGRPILNLVDARIGY